MTDGPAFDDTTTSNPSPSPPPSPPPPPGDDPRRTPLRRSNSDRVVAGVAGGIARHFGTDPVIIRLGFVVVTLLGGSGVLLYLISWLVIPREDQQESAAMDALRGGRRPGSRSFLALVLLVAAILILPSSLVWWPAFGIGDGLFLPLLILAAGVALLVWPANGADRQTRRHVERGDWDTEREAFREEWRQERDAWRDSRRQWRHGYRRGFDPPTQTTATGVTAPDGAGGPGEHASPHGGPAAPPPPVPAAQPPLRPKPFIGPLTVAILLLFSGATLFVERVGWVGVDVAVFFGICLAVIGVALVLSAFIGRARGLIWLGVLLLPVAWVVSAVDIEWYGGIGEENVRVSDPADLDDAYRWGIGEFRVDLSELDLDGGRRELAVGLSIGELTVFVPHTLEIDLDLDGRIGEVAVQDAEGRLVDDGYDLSLERRTGEPDGGILELDVDLGIGRAEVIVCGAEGGPRCP